MYQVYPPVLLLEPGNYEVWFTLESDTQTCDTSVFINIPVRWNNESDDPNKIIGGVRIKTITHYDEEGNITVKKEYDYTDDNGYSSGRMNYYPTYHLYYYGEFSGRIFPLGYKRFVMSTNPLASNNETYIGYAKVTEKQINETQQTIGKIENYYITSDNIQNGYNAIDPATGNNLSPVRVGNFYYFFPIDVLPPPSSIDYIRGKLTRQLIYKDIGGTAIKAKEKYFIYKYLGFTPLPNALNEINSTILLDVNSQLISDNYINNQEKAKEVTGVNVMISSRPGVEYVYYNIYGGYAVLHQTIEKNYFPQGITTQVYTSEYKQNNDIIEYFTPITTQFENSKGDMSRTENIYVFNKPNLTPSEQNLLDHNALYILLEKKKFVQNQRTAIFKNEYDFFSNNSLNSLSKQKFSKGLNAPEEVIIYHQYDNEGNPVLVSKKDGPSIYYIWGYQHTKIIGEIKNFPSQNNHALMNLIETAIQLSNSDNDNMINNPQGMEYQLWTSLDQIRRSLPSDSQMTFYTYDPLVGVTSITDEKGNVSYFYYDAFNRLKFIKDSNGNIIKEYEYHYKDQ